MQSPQSYRNPGHRPGIAVARQNDEPLSDGALVALLGGVYVGGLATFLAAAYSISMLF